MRKLYTSAPAVGVWLGTTALLAESHHTEAASATNEASFSAHGAFRDGLYLGKFAAERGQTMHPPIGRWSTDQNRSMFAARYRCGYAESLAAGLKGQTRH